MEELLGSRGMRVADHELASDWLWGLRCGAQGDDAGGDRLEPVRQPAEDRSARQRGSGSHMRERGRERVSWSGSQSRNGEPVGVSGSQRVMPSEQVQEQE